MSAGERGAGCFAPVLTSVRSLAGRPRGARRRRVAHATGAYRVARRPKAPLARKPSAEVYRRRETATAPRGCKFCPILAMRAALASALLLLASGAAALSLHAAPPTARFASARRAAGAVCVEADVSPSDVDVADSSFVDPGMKGAVSWQEELETLLAPETGQEEREMMLKDLLARAPEISEEVQAALQSKDMGSLLPESSRSKQLLDDIGVVQRQVLCLPWLHGVRFYLLVVCRCKCEAHGSRGRWMLSTDEEPIS